jgi:hypothetical protein
VIFDATPSANRLELGIIVTPTIMDSYMNAMRKAAAV